jgi:hypothetical protein
MEDLISKLKLTNESINQMELYDIPISFKGLRVNFNSCNIKDDKNEYKKFYIAIYFIVLELNKIPGLKHYLKEYTTDFMRNIEPPNEDPTKNMEDSKQYKMNGFKKILTVDLKNAPNEIVNKIPKNLYGVMIIPYNKIDKLIKFPFGLNIFKFENNNSLKISDDYRNDNGIFSFLYNIFYSKKNILKVSYSGYLGDDHIIEYEDNTITFIVKERTKRTIQQLESINRTIDIPKNNYEYIIYNKIYL